jgi:hypothetical protein
MRLSEARSRELLRTHGAYVTEACDGCGKILRPVSVRVLCLPSHPEGYSLAMDRRSLCLILTSCSAPPPRLSHASNSATFTL